MSNDPWKHRSTSMKCNTCMWFIHKKTTESNLSKQLDIPEVTIGRCRKRAPTLNGYPVVFRTDWCGDHKLDEGKV